MGQSKPRRVKYSAATKAERADGWTNLVTALGTSRDKRMHAWYMPDIVTDVMALRLWRSNDICKRVIEARPNTAFRRGVRLKLDTKEMSETVGAALEDLELVEAFIKALCYENAYGGAAIFPVIDDVGLLEEPLDKSSTYQTVRAFHVLEPRELSPVSYYTDINDQKFRQVKLWRFIPLGANALISMQYIHESRLIVFPGIRVSNQYQVGQYPGFGDSNLNGVYEVVRDYGSAWGNTGAILADFAAGTLAMKDYAKLMREKGGEAIVRARMRVFSEMLSSIRMGVMDSDDKYNRSTTPLGGLSDILHDYAVRVAAAAEQPVTVMFGEAPAGLNATGDNDIRGWYDTVAAWREKHVKRRFERAVEIFLGAQDSPTNGNVPDVWSVEFPPLWEPSEKEQADTRKTIAETDQIYYTMSAATAKTIAKSRWGGDTYSGEMHVDWDELAAQEKAADDMATEAANAELANIDPATGQPIAAPAAGATPAVGSAPGASADVQKTALNGAQVEAMLNTVARMVNGEIPRESAQAALEIGFQISAADATRMLGPIGWKPEPKAAPPQFGGPPKPPVPPPPPPKGDEAATADEPAAKAA